MFPSAEASATLSQISRHHEWMLRGQISAGWNSAIAVDALKHHGRCPLPVFSSGHDDPQRADELIRGSLVGNETGCYKRRADEIIGISCSTGLEPVCLVAWQLRVGTS
jgi:hypothetical protein